jgi:tetratricopeptide (TPR) repeat protein
MRSCDPAERSVLRALAAFRTPVTPASLATVLAGDLSEDQVRAGLARVTRRSIARAADGDRYFLPPSSLHDALDLALETGDRGSTPSPLLARAAYELRRHRVDPPVTLGDLDVTFAELGALLRARRHGAAYRVIEWIDDVLREWHGSIMLLGHREQVHGKLDDDHLEMVNDNQLAHLYTLTGAFPEADAAYHRALASAERRGDAAARAVLEANAAGLAQQRGNSDDARRGYQLALKAASSSGDVRVQVQALEGLADCDRRHGRFPDALAHATAALAVTADDPDAQAFVSSRQVRCRLKLAGWHAELGDPTTAERHVLAAERQAGERGDQWLVGACLDGRADVLLAQDRLGEAVAVAVSAADHALRVNDAVTLMRARTTLCTADLMRPDGPAGPHAIEGMLRYRRPGHSLIVLAMCALLAAQRQDRTRSDALFSQLRQEADERVKRDGRDFAARDLRALALCALGPGHGGTVQDATEDFAEARRTTAVPTPGLVDRLVWMLRLLGDLRGTTAAIEPALTVLRAARSGLT